MKTNLKNILPTIILIVTILFIGSSCDNESAPYENDDQCNYQGLSYVNTTDNTEILISETDLNTQFFPNASTGPFENPGVEIAGTNSDGFSVFFVTNVITDGASGAGKITFNSGESQSVTATCQRAGTQVGDEFRYDIEISGFEVEFCVTIDEVL